MGFSQRKWFTVFMFYDDLEARMQLEAHSQDQAEREAIDAFIEDMDDEDDGFEVVDTGVIRSAIVFRTYQGCLDEEPKR